MGRTTLSVRQAKGLGLIPNKLIPFGLGLVLGFILGAAAVHFIPSVPTGQRTPTTTASDTTIPFIVNQ